MLFQSSGDKKFYQLLSNAAGIIVKCSDLFGEMVDNLPSSIEYSARLKALESDGDRLHSELLRLLNSSFITPIEREDILALAGHLDDMIDGIEAVAARLAIYGVTTSDSHISSFAGILRGQAAHVAAGVDSIAQRGWKAVQENNVQIKLLEKEADIELRGALVDLFGRVGDPLYVIKMKEIYETLEATTDQGERIAEALDSVVVKNA